MVLENAGDCCEMRPCIDGKYGIFGPLGSSGSYKKACYVVFAWPAACSLANCQLHWSRVMCNKEVVLQVGEWGSYQADDLYGGSGGIARRPPRFLRAISLLHTTKRASPWAITVAILDAKYCIVGCKVPHSLSQPRLR